MKISYFGSTWAASCVASTGGALYAAVIAVLVSQGRIGLMEVLWVFVISVFLSLPVLVAGSATIGWWVTRILTQRVRTNRLLLFAMVGCLMGVIADLVLIAAIAVILPHSLEMPRGVGEWLNAGLIGSIPVFCLTLAGLIAGAHVRHSERVPVVSNVC